MQKQAIYYQEDRRVMTAFLPEEYNKVLEIGCGEGNFTRNLKPGCEIWGVEVNSAAGKVALQNMKHVLIGRYDQVADTLPNKYFDLIICNDVIEHMEDHDSFFHAIKEKMKPQGYLIGSIPNVRFYRNLYELLLKKDWRYVDSGILDSTHLRFFTEKSLRRALAASAYRVEKFEGINSARHGSSGFKRILKEVFFGIVLIVTFGTYRDIQFLQFGFRVKQV
jgi:2-polyprenyl-3-methyl-5-hydroxy-6-metoxy-1,4-benzoquinol methylase